MNKFETLYTSFLHFFCVICASISARILRIRSREYSSRLRNAMKTKYNTAKESTKTRGNIKIKFVTLLHEKKIT